MRRILFYILRAFAFLSRLVGKSLYMRLIVMAHKSQGVKFVGRPEYIHQDAYLDPSGGLTIHEGAVISTKVIILTHDWSFLKRKDFKNDGDLEKKAYKPVVIGANSFIGAGSVVLPGTVIGCNCIVGAGAVVKRGGEDYSILVGNPARRIENKKL